MSDSNSVLLKRFVDRWFLQPTLDYRLPLLSWLPEYNTGWLLNDLNAGLTVFVLLIPQGMAYAILAGLPPVYGLYNAIVPQFVYFFFGTSRQLAVGAMAITSLISAASVETAGVDSSDSKAFIEASLGVSLWTGIIMLLMGILGLGSLTNLLSQSVLTGFITGSGLVIALSQLKYVLGLSFPRMSYSHETIAYILTHLHEINGFGLMIGFASFFTLYAVKRFRRNYRERQKAIQTKQQKDNAQSQHNGTDTDAAHGNLRETGLHDQQSAKSDENTGTEHGSSRDSKTTANASLTPPKTIIDYLYNLSALASIFVVVVATAVSYGIHKNSSYTLPVVGGVPAGLPTPSAPAFDSKYISGGVTLAIISFAGNWAIAKKFAKEFDYEVSARSELVAMGLANMIGAFFGSFVVAGGLARSAVNAESGARTPFAGVVAAVGVIIALLFLTKLFFYLPMGTLGAIIEVAVLSMIDFEAMLNAFRGGAYLDVLVMLTACWVTFFAGISIGLGIGVLLSFVVLVYNAASPPITAKEANADLLLQISQRRISKLLSPEDDVEANAIPSTISLNKNRQLMRVAIVDMPGLLFFTNVTAFQRKILYHARFCNTDSCKQRAGCHSGLSRTGSADRNGLHRSNGSFSDVTDLMDNIRNEQKDVRFGAKIDTVHGSQSDIRNGPTSLRRRKSLEQQRDQSVDSATELVGHDNNEAAVKKHDTTIEAIDSDENNHTADAHAKETSSPRATMTEQVCAALSLNDAPHCSEYVADVVVVNAQCWGRRLDLPSINMLKELAMQLREFTPTRMVLRRRLGLKVEDVTTTGKHTGDIATTAGDKKGVRLGFIGMHPDIRKVLRKFGIESAKVLPPCYFFDNELHCRQHVFAALEAEEGIYRSQHYQHTAHPSSGTASAVRRTSRNTTNNTDSGSYGNDDGAVDIEMTQFDATESKSTANSRTP